MDLDEITRQLAGTLAPYSAAERAQLLLQAEAVLNASDAGRGAEHASALLDMFKEGILEAARGEDGKVYLRLTELGLTQAAALVRQMAGHKAN